MYNYILTKEFITDLKKLNDKTREIIFVRIQKIISEDISRKHLKYGLPYFVEKITLSSRLIYKFEDNKELIIIDSFFSNHKDYEK